MKDRRIPGAGASLGFTAVALALTGSPRPALAQPNDPGEPPPAAPVGGAEGAVPAPDSEPPAGPAEPPPAGVEPTSPAPEPEPDAAAPPAAPEPPVAEALPPAAQVAEAEPPAESWFAREPLTLSAGQGDRTWRVTLYGFIEADLINDSTRSYGDAIGPTLVARDDTFEGHEGRTQFSMRNTRIGLRFESPRIAGIHPLAVFEGDFFGNQPSNPPETSEAAFFESPTFRARHAYLKLENRYVDVLAGLTYDLFGWQNTFNPCSVEFLGLPNQVFSRSTQLRLSHAFGAEGPVGLEIAAAAARPAQRDGQFPDGHGGLRFSVNRWKGITTPGNVGTSAFPLSVGVSGVVRRFKVDAFMPPPTQRSNEAYGWGVSADALLPVIPAKSADDRGNRLTVVGGFVTGTGIGDLITAGGGAEFPTLPNPAQANPPPLYEPNIDNGIVSFDTQGVLHTIDWEAFRVGLQYYLPPRGRVFLSLNYTEAHSANLGELFPRGGAEIELLTRVADRSQYADANLFWDATPAVRFGASFQVTRVEYLDGDSPRNFRSMGQAVYVF